jgi:hypothetical protein
VVQVGIASATAAYRAAQETAVVVSEVIPAVSVGRAHVRAVVEALPAWGVEVAAVVAAAGVVDAVAAVAGGDNQS